MSERVILTNVGDFPAKGRAIFDVKGMTVLVVKAEDVFFCGQQQMPALGSSTFKRKN